MRPYPDVPVQAGAARCQLRGLLLHQLFISGPPLRDVIPDAGGPAPPRAYVTRTDGEKFKVLLVEDQTLIALDTEAMLLELGAANVESVTSAQAALDWLITGEPDVGVLDINLGISNSFDVAAELVRRGIPFVFTTGYGDALMIPTAFSGVPIVHKPYTREALERGISLCMGIPGG